MGHDIDWDKLLAFHSGEIDLSNIGVGAPEAEGEVAENPPPEIEKVTTEHQRELSESSGSGIVSTEGKLGSLKNQIAHKLGLYKSEHFVRPVPLFKDKEEERFILNNRKFIPLSALTTPIGFDGLPEGVKKYSYDQKGYLVDFYGKVLPLYLTKTPFAQPEEVLNEMFTFVNFVVKRLKNPPFGKDDEKLEREYISQMARYSAAVQAILSARKRIMEELAYYTQRVGNDFMEVLPPSLKTLFDLTEELEKKSTLVKNENLSTAIGELNATITSAVDNALKRFAEIYTDREKFIKARNELLKDPEVVEYLKQYGYDEKRFPGLATKSLLLIKLFKEEFLKREENLRGVLSVLADIKEDEISSLTDIEKELLQEAENTISTFLEDLKGEKFVPSKDPAELEALEVQANNLTPLERKRLQQITAKLHNLDTLLDKVYRGVLTEEDIESIFAKGELGIAGPGGIFDTAEAEYVRGFFKDYLKGMDEQVEEEKLNRDTYLKVYENFLSQKLAKDTAEEAIELSRTFSRLFLISRVWGRDIALEEFGSCVMKSITGEGGGVNRVKGCFERFAQRRKQEAVAAEKISKQMQGNVWAMLFAPAVLAADLRWAVKLTEAQLLEDKARAMEIRLRKALIDIAKEPDLGEIDRKVKEEVFKEAGYFAAIGSKREIDFWKKQLTYDYLKEVIPQDLSTLKKLYEKEIGKRLLLNAVKIAKSVSGLDDKVSEEDVREILKTLKEKGILEGTMKKATQLTIQEEPRLYIRYLIAKKGLEYAQKGVFYGTSPDSPDYIDPIILKGLREDIERTLKSKGLEVEEFRSLINEEVDKFKSYVVNLTKNIEKGMVEIREGGKTLLIALNPERFRDHFVTLRNLPVERRKDYILDVLNLNEESIREGLKTGNLKNGLQLINTSLTTKGFELQVSKEVIQKLENYRPKQGVNLNAASSFLDALSERVGGREADLG